MAGVYIKDVRLPDACWNCGWDPCMLWNEDRGDLPKHPNCPLVEVPDHGDLIDIDNMLEDFAELRDYDFALRGYVVIPAEEGEE